LKDEEFINVDYIIYFLMFSIILVGIFWVFIAPYIRKRKKGNREEVLDDLDSKQ